MWRVDAQAQFSDSTSHTRADAGSGSAEFGLILLDSSRKPIYTNERTLSVLSYPHSPVRGEKMNSILAERIAAILDKKGQTEDSPFIILSGRRRYICRSFVLGPSAEGSPKAAIAITLERHHNPLYDLEARFQLTEREREAVEHLSEGLTSKEIAKRMNISPNTVKTFLRLVMIKMGVTTRSGVIGKIIERARAG